MSDPVEGEDQVLTNEFDFIKNVSQFYNVEELSDVVLRVGDCRYFGHKFVLAKSSGVFRCMLYDEQWTKTLGGELVLNESPECQAVFDKFLKYLYTAGVQISTETAVGILCLADKYQVNSLKELCCKYMVIQAKSPMVQNALNWYSWAKALYMELLIKQCTKTIAWNAQEIVSSPDWLNMDIDFLSDILQNSELVICNEYKVYDAVQQWLLQAANLDRLAENCKRLMPLVRFPQMTVTQLYDVEKSDLASNEACRVLLQGLLGQAYRFRSLCPAQHTLPVLFTDDYYQPRDFTDLTVDNVRMQNTLRFGIQVDVRMYSGPVPSENRDGEWKITYRKQGDSWNLQIYCHESAMVNNEAKIMATIIIYNEDNRVIQVCRTSMYTCSRGNNLNVNVMVTDPDSSKNMAVIIKPVTV